MVNTALSPQEVRKFELLAPSSDLLLRTTTFFGLITVKKIRSKTETSFQDDEVAQD